MKHFLYEFSALSLSHLAPLDCIGECREVVLTMSIPALVYPFACLRRLVYSFTSKRVIR